MRVFRFLLLFAVYPLLEVIGVLCAAGLMMLVLWGFRGFMEWVVSLVLAAPWLFYVALAVAVGMFGLLLVASALYVYQFAVECWEKA